VSRIVSNVIALETTQKFNLRMKRDNDGAAHENASWIERSCSLHSTSAKGQVQRGQAASSFVAATARLAVAPSSEHVTFERVAHLERD